MASVLACELGWNKPAARERPQWTDQVDFMGFSSSISSFSSPASRLGDAALESTMPSGSVSPVTKRRRSILSLRYRVDSATCASTHSLAPKQEKIQPANLSHQFSRTSGKNVRTGGTHSRLEPSTTA